MHDTKEEKNFYMAQSENKPYWRDAVIAFARMSGWVAFPIIFALFLGKELDKVLETKPLFFLILTAGAFAVSIFGILKELSRYLRNIKNGTERTTD
jgi:F0F1-type ATP synthase assembly protein I